MFIGVYERVYAERSNGMYTVVDDFHESYEHARYTSERDAIAVAVDAALFEIREHGEQFRLVLRDDGLISYLASGPAGHGVHVRKATVSRPFAVLSDGSSADADNANLRYANAIDAISAMRDVIANIVMDGGQVSFDKATSTAHAMYDEDGFGQRYMRFTLVITDPVPALSEHDICLHACVEQATDAALDACTDMCDEDELARSGLLPDEDDILVTAHMPAAECEIVADEDAPILTCGDHEADMQDLLWNCACGNVSELDNPSCPECGALNPFFAQGFI